TEFPRTGARVRQCDKEAPQRLPDKPKQAFMLFICDQALAATGSLPRPFHPLKRVGANEAHAGLCCPLERAVEGREEGKPSVGLPPTAPARARGAPSALGAYKIVHVSMAQASHGPLSQLGSKGAAVRAPQLEGCGAPIRLKMAEVRREDGPHLNL